MNIIDKAVSEIVPYENNPRKNEDAVIPVANSIEQFGFKVPIIIDKKNTIVAGHTRLKAAEYLGMKTVPCIIADDLTDDEIKAFRLADNKVAEIADWDFVSLDTELAGIEEIDMSLFGFDIDVNADDAEVEEVDTPDDVETRCKTGDIWILGNHRLICGDATDRTCIETLMGGGTERHCNNLAALQCRQDGSALLQ